MNWWHPVSPEVEVEMGPKTEELIKLSSRREIPQISPQPRAVGGFPLHSSGSSWEFSPWGTLDTAEHKSTVHKTGGLVKVSILQVETFQHLVPRMRVATGSKQQEIEETLSMEFDQVRRKYPK